MATENVTPPETALAGGFSEGAKNRTEGLNKRLNRFSQAKHKQLIIRKFIEASYYNYTKEQRILLAKVIPKLSYCANDLLFRHYYTLDEYRLLKLMSCDKHLLCPFCAIRRGSKYCIKYKERLDVVLQENPHIVASHMIVTIKNGDNFMERFNHLSRGYQLVRQRIKNSLRGTSRSEFGKLKGYVGAYEVTNNGNGWHPHMHFVILHNEPIYTSVLQAEWERITGDSWDIEVNGLSSIEEGFAEVFKYALKFSTMSPEHVVESFLSLRGRRLVVSGGLFYGVKVPDDLSDDPIEDLPYIDFFFRYFDKVGYSLTSFEKSEDQLRS